MSGLPDGKYLIVHAATSAPPPLPVGVNEEGGFVKPVVVGGKNKIVGSLSPFSADCACMMPSPCLFLT